MNELLPYEEHLRQQWNDLSLPDEDTAWADMKRRLEEDNDDTGLFWWRPGCALGGVLLVVLLATGWWLIRPEKWFTNEKEIRQSGSKERKDLLNKTPLDSINVVALKAGDTNQLKQNQASQPQPAVSAARQRSAAQI